LGGLLEEGSGRVFILFFQNLCCYPIVEAKMFYVQGTYHLGSFASIFGSAG